MKAALIEAWNWLVETHWVIGDTTVRLWPFVAFAVILVLFAALA